MTRRSAPVAALVLALAGAAVAATFQTNRVDLGRVGSAYALAVAPDGTRFVTGAFLNGSAPGVPMAGVWRYTATGGSATWTASGTGVAAGTSVFEESGRGIAIGPGSSTAFGVFVGGALWTTTGGSEAWLERLTPAGVPVWSLMRNGPASEDDAINAVAVSPAGEVVVAGRASMTSGDGDLWIARYSGDGAFLGEYTSMAFFGADEEALAVTTDASGSIYVAGYVTIPGEGKNAYVAKYDAALSVQVWERWVNGTSSSTDYYTGIAVDPAGGALYVAGVTTGAAPFTDILVKRYDAATGDQVWTRTIDGGEGDHDTASACALTTGGDLVVAGAVDRPTAAFTDIWVSRFAPDGSQRWELARVNQNAYIDEARGVGVDAAGTLHAAGFVRGFLTTNADDPRIWVGSIIETQSAPVAPMAAGTFARPNPYRPGSGGEFDATGITFRGLAPGGTVRILTVTGAAVIVLTDADRDGSVSWDAKGGDGTPAASGVYLWVADDERAGMTRGKVVIVR